VRGAMPGLKAIVKEHQITTDGTEIAFNAGLKAIVKEHQITTHDKPLLSR